MDSGGVEPHRPLCKRGALPIELPAHKNWRERRESNPLERDPQSRAASFGFNPRKVTSCDGAGRGNRNLNLRFTKPLLCHLSYTGPHSSANGKAPVAIGIGIQVPAPLVNFQTHRPQNEPAGMNTCRQGPAQQRHARLFRRSIRLAVVVLSATCHKVFPGILTSLRSGNNMVER